MSYELQAKLVAAVATLDLPNDRAVAHKLMLGSFRGVRGRCAEGPVAKYLSFLVGAPVEVGVVSAWHVGDYDTGIVDMPIVVQDFIRAFERGVYPGLELDTAETV